MPGGVNFDMARTPCFQSTAGAFLLFPKEATAMEWWHSLDILEASLLPSQEGPTSPCEETKSTTKRRMAGYVFIYVIFIVCGIYAHVCRAYVCAWRSEQDIWCPAQSCPPLFLFLETSSLIEARSRLEASEPQ